MYDVGERYCWFLSYYNFATFGGYYALWWRSIREGLFPTGLPCLVLSIVYNFDLEIILLFYVCNFIFLFFFFRLNVHILRSALVIQEGTLSVWQNTCEGVKRSN